MHNGGYVEDNIYKQPLTAFTKITAFFHNIKSPICKTTCYQAFEIGLDNIEILNIQPLFYCTNATPLEINP